MRGAGTSIAGNAVGPGIVVDTSRHLNQVLAIDRDARTARRPARRRARRAPARGRAARPALRTRPVHAHPLHDRRDDRQQRLRLAGPGLRPHVDNVAALRVAARRRHGGSTLAGVPTHLGLAALVDGHLATVRTEFGRFGRQVSGYSFEHLLPENGRRFDRFLVGSEGTLAVVLEADRPAGRGRAGPSARGARLPVDGRRRRRRTRAAGARRWSPARASTSGSSRWCARGHGPSCRRARAGCSPRSPVTTRPRWRRWPQAVARTAGVPHRVVTDPAEQAALWRIREDGAGLAARSLDRPAQAGWEDAAVPPERLGDYLRDFDALLQRAPAWTACPTATSATAACTCGSTSRSTTPAGAAGSAGSSRTPPTWSRRTAARMSGEHGDGRARSELLPRMYSAEAIALLRQVKRLLDPEQPAQPRACWSTRRRSTPTCGWPHRRRPVRTDAAARTRRRVVRRRGPPVHRRRQVPRRQHRRRRRDVPVVPGHPGGEGLHPRPRPRPAGPRRRAALEASTTRPSSEALDLCLSCKGCARDCPTGIDMATYKSEALHQNYRRQAAAALALHARPAAALGQADAAAAGQRDPRAADPSPGSPRPRPGVDQRRSLPRFSADRCDSGGRGGRAAGRRTPSTSGSGPTRSPTGSPPTPAARRSAARGDRACGRAVIPEAACCGLTWITTGQLDRGAADPRAAPSTRCTATSPPACPVVGLEPCCLAALRDDAGQLLDDPRAGEVARGVRSLAELLAERARGTGARPTSPGSRSSPSRTATTRRCWAGTPTRPCSPGPGRRSPGSAAAAGWPATSGSSRATTRCRWRSPSTTCSPPYEMRAGGRRARRRLLVPHPARRPGRASGTAPRAAAGGRSNRFDPRSGSR